MKLKTISKIIFLIFIIDLLIVPSINAITYHRSDFREEISEKYNGIDDQKEIISFIYGNYVGEEDFVFFGAFFNLELSAYMGTSIRIISYTSLLPPQKNIVEAVFLKAPIFIGFLKRSGSHSPTGIIFGIALGDIYWREKKYD